MFQPVLYYCPFCDAIIESISVNRDDDDPLCGTCGNVVEGEPDLQYDAAYDTLEEKYM